MTSIIKHWMDGADKSRQVIEIPNVDRNDLAQLFGELGMYRGVEVGTEYGTYAETIAKAIGHHFHSYTFKCVDPYQAYGDYREHVSQLKLDRIYAEARERLIPLGVELIRETSVDGAKLFADESLDWVYLDGNHSLPYVISDLHAWVPKVRKGGIIAGHDYIRRNNSLKYQCHVVEAITAWTQCYMIKPLFIVGTKKQVAGQKRDAIRSWFWVKE